MPNSLFDVLLAITPPLAVLILMIGFRWGGSKAGPVGWLVALVIAVLRFGADMDVLGYAHIRAFILTFDVVYIVWAALLLYFVVDKAGAMKVIANWFIELTGDDVLRVLLLGWVFTSFLQGVGGFGVPVAIVAPILVGLGLRPLAAVVIPSVGHAWAVTFGSLGSSFITMTGVTGMDGYELAPPAAVLLGFSAIACGLLAAHAYAGWQGIKRAFPAVIFIGAVMAVVQYVVVTNGLWNIGSACAGLAGLIAGLWVTRWPIYRRETDQSIANTALSADKTEDTRPIPSFPVAIAGYMTLVILAVLIVGVQPIKELFAESNILLAVPEVQTSKEVVTEASSLKIKLFGSTGAVLLYSSLITYFLYKRKKFYNEGAGQEILQGVRKKGVKSAIGILSMVAMAIVMANSGMTQEIASWLKEAVPADLYAFVATGIGALGAFMTGSNTNSNAVFAGLQMETADLLKLSIPMVLATQTASASIASLLAPAKIMVGASTVGLGGDEGIVLRKLVSYGGVLLLLIAMMSFILLQLGY